MSTHTIVGQPHVIKDKDTFHVVAITVRAADGVQTDCEWATGKGTPIPGAGATVTGEIEASQYGPKWKPERKSGGGFGGGKRNPAETKRIERQHSQEMALRHLAIKQSRGELGTFNPDVVAAATDWYQRDLETSSPTSGGDSTGQPPPEPAPSSPPEAPAPSSSEEPDLPF